MKVLVLSALVLCGLADANAQGLNFITRNPATDSFRDGQYFDTQRRMDEEMIESMRLTNEARRRAIEAERRAAEAEAEADARVARAKRRQ